MNTPQPNAVDALIAAYLDYLEGDAPKPSLDGLDHDDRTAAEELISAREAGRGLDPNAVRSLDFYRGGFVG